MEPINSNYFTQMIQYTLLILNPFKYMLIFNLILQTIPVPIKSQTDTLICDNGGFESNFLYYTGQTTVFDYGSDDCNPTQSGSPSVWSSASLPSFRKFEIVTNGIDTLTGINRTKFGSKALLLNHRYSHILTCGATDKTISKIIKRFKVTEENRDFTVWFAAILEDPGSGHSNREPFFSISCDRAPNSDLCFDALQLNCAEEYDDELCTFGKINLIDWTCHRIKIPKNMIDSIATLEIMAADCGEGLHFGYAYVDGICEECTGSALGTATLLDSVFDCEALGIKHYSCAGDTISICGTYTLPTVCGDWQIDSLKVPGFDIFDVEFDTENQTFCFKLSIADFPEDSCRDVYVIAYFSSDLSGYATSISNSIEICDTDFLEYHTEVTTGTCQNNNSTSMLSDDYYYVHVLLDANCGETWTMYRQLHDPYPNESGLYIIKTGSGLDSIDLGPMIIQEGDWDLIIDYGPCNDTFEIVAPNFCSGGCLKFRGTKINNITCTPDPPVVTADPYDDTWSFDIYITGSGSYALTGLGTFSYGSTHTINNLPMDIECRTYTITDQGNTNCTASFVVCPPKPCSVENGCELEAYVTEIYCDNEDSEFYVRLNISGASTYLCYEALRASDGTTHSYGSISSYLLGPFDESIFLVVKICTTSACNCSTPSCFKTINVPFPDCDNLEYRFKNSYDSKSIGGGELIVIPNPIIENEIILRSTLEATDFEVLNSYGVIVHRGNFNDREYKITLNMSSGLYFIRYKNCYNKITYLKFIKL